MSSRFLSRSLDISPFGAKVRTNQRLKMGTSVRLKVVPREGSPLRVGATVWRVDADGLAFLFSSGIQHHLIRATHHLATHESGPGTGTRPLSPRPSSDQGWPWRGLACR